MTKSHYSDERGASALAGSSAGSGDMRSHSLEGDEAITRGIVRSGDARGVSKNPGLRA